MATRTLVLAFSRSLISCACGFIVGMLLVNVVQNMIGSKHIKCGLWRYNYVLGSDCVGAHKNVKAVTSLDDHFLFVGIMTARKFLTTRAMASSKTWVPKIPGKVVYFMEQGDSYKGDLDVVQLEGVSETDYPPQKKSFAMIHYISRHYAKDYEWIVRADDDVYIKVDELVTFLKSIDSRQLLYIGQPGFGKKAEKGKLGLSGAYCMGGPGVVMSSRLVQSLSPHLPACLNSTVTEHEDTELGRCIYQVLKVVCSSTLEKKSKFYHNYPESWDKSSSFKKELGQSEENALTLHPFKESSYVFKVANFLTNRTVEKLKIKEKTLMAEIGAIDWLNMAATNNFAVLGKWTDVKQNQTPVITQHATNVSRLFQQDTRTNQIWDVLLHQSLYSAFLETGMLRTSSASKGRLHVHVNTLNKVQTGVTYQYGKKYHLESVNVSYQCLTSERGVEEMIFLRSWVDQQKMTVPIYVRRNLPPNLVEFRESYREQVEINNITIHILLEVFKQSSRYRHFLEQHKKTVAEYQGKVKLMVVAFSGEHKLISALTDAILRNNSQLEIRVIHVNITFHHGNGLVLAMDELHDTSLLLLMDVDMEYTADFLHRVSKNTVLDQVVYFPVIYNLFSPEVLCYTSDNCINGTDGGHSVRSMRRSNGFLVASMYKRDLLRTGHFRSKLLGWNWQDVELYEKFLTSGITVIRSADNGIVYRRNTKSIL